MKKITFIFLSTIFLASCTSVCCDSKSCCDSTSCCNSKSVCSDSTSCCDSTDTICKTTVDIDTLDN